MSDPQADDPFKADKRKDETVMLSQDNLADIVAQAKGDAPADQGSPEQSSAPAQPVATPAAAAPAASSSSGDDSSSMWLLVGGVALILLLAVVAYLVL